MSCLCFSFINSVETQSLPELIHLLLRQRPPVAYSVFTFLILHGNRILFPLRDESPLGFETIVFTFP